MQARALLTVGPVGFEPTTYGLKVRYSAIELRSQAGTSPCGEGEESAEAKRSQLLPPVGNEIAAGLPTAAVRRSLGSAR
jgi:hypothetical protein